MSVLLVPDAVAYLWEREANGGQRRRGITLRVAETQNVAGLASQWPVHGIVECKGVRQDHVIVNIHERIDGRRLPRGKQRSDG